MILQSIVKLEQNCTWYKQHVEVSSSAVCLPFALDSLQWLVFQTTMVFIWEEGYILACVALVLSTAYNLCNVAFMLYWILLRLPEEIFHQIWWSETCRRQICKLRFVCEVWWSTNSCQLLFCRTSRQDVQGGLELCGWRHEKHSTQYLSSNITKLMAMKYFISVIVWDKLLHQILYSWNSRSLSGICKREPSDF